MKDEYDYPFNSTPNPDVQPGAEKTSEAPQAEHVFAYSQDDMDDLHTRQLSQTDYDMPQTGQFPQKDDVKTAQLPQEDDVKTAQLPQEDAVQTAQLPREDADFPKTESVQQEDFGQPVQESVKVPPVQPEPETVHAEPAPEYSTNGCYAGYQNIPPYGQRNTHGAYASQQPYGQQTTYGSQQPYGSAYVPQSQPPQQPAKKDKKGLKIFFRVLIAVIIVGLVLTVIRLALDRPDRAQPSADDNTTTTVAQAVDAPEMETNASPASDSGAGSGQVLTPTQIAAKVRAWSVGILVYSGSSTGTAGQGSGVLWKEDGSKTYTYIITCAHVVSGNGYTYSVQTEDGKTYDAELVGADAKTDLAVLRIKATGLSLAEFGDSSALKVGDPVYAIGNPGGTEFFGSFTSGIVSAIDRSVKNTYTMLCIQHTAAINPGNSGGALINAYGQVIGINSQKIASASYEGMGFAIPLKSAQSIITSLASYGYVKDRPRLGITYAEALNYQQYSMIIKIRGLPSGTLVISEISSDSTLADTEAKSGDMIIKVNGEDMTTPNVLLDKIENGKVGDKLKLTLCRMDNNYQFKQFDVTVTLIEETRQNNQKEETTTQSYYSFDPFDFFNGNYGNYFGN